MKIDKLVYISLAAMALAACGSGNDESKPDDDKNKLPPKSQACIDAKELCTFDGKQWVIKKKPGGDKPDQSPAIESDFDYSDIGVTDKVEPQKKGFGFYNKGEESPLDNKMFKNLVTLSPSISWSSNLEYDPDLYNFVAIRLGDKAQKDVKNPIKFMFDKIGIENQAENKNLDFFGKGAHDGSTVGNVGVSSIAAVEETTPIKPTTYKWNRIPAVVNTFMYRLDNGLLAYNYADADHRLFMNQEEEATSAIGSGKNKLRVYGHNAFLIGETNNKNTDYLEPENLSAPSKTDSLETRKDKKTYNPVNFVWYDLSNFGARKKKADFKHVKDGSKDYLEFHTALDQYKALTAGKYLTQARFPTDVEFDVLENVQFGRLTGQGVDPESGDLPEYGKRNLKGYPFTSSTAAIAGNKEGEDWYFARGVKPTAVEVIEGYKQVGHKIGYDGQALMFGLDYRPTKPVAPGKEGEQSTNAVKPATHSTFGKILLDGKQNFVRMEWDPATGEIKGRVFGVWTLATYWRKANDKGGEQLRVFGESKKDSSNNIVFDEAKITSAAKHEFDAAAAKKIQSEFRKDGYDFADWKDPAAENLPMTGLIDITDVASAQHVATSAYSLEPWALTLVTMDGKVTEGTNSFGGVAVRVRDQSKGLFAGAFFGAKASEIAGVINSQTGSMKDENLTDPGDKWGGSFGAKHQASEVDEDLIFKDADVNYLTSTEFWNN